MILLWHISFATKSIKKLNAQYYFMSRIYVEKLAFVHILANLFRHLLFAVSRKMGNYTCNMVHFFQCPLMRHLYEFRFVHTQYTIFIAVALLSDLIFEAGKKSKPLSKQKLLFIKENFGKKIWYSLRCTEIHLTTYSDFDCAFMIV